MFELKPVYNASKGFYEIEKYDEALAECKKYIEDILKNHTQPISNEEMLKIAKNDRTDIRKQREAIKSARLHINEIFFGTFNRQLKEIEKTLNDGDYALKQQVDAYNESIGKVKQTQFTLTIKTFDKKVIDKLQQQALKLGCSAEIK